MSANGPKKPLGCDDEILDCAVDAGCFGVGALTSYFQGGDPSDMLYAGARATGFTRAMVMRDDPVGVQLAITSTAVGGCIGLAKGLDTVYTAAETAGVVLTLYHSGKLEKTFKQNQESQNQEVTQETRLDQNQTLLHRTPGRRRRRPGQNGGNPG